MIEGVEAVTYLAAFSPVALLFLMGRGLRQATAISKFLWLAGWLFMSLGLFALLGIVSIDFPRIVELGEILGEYAGEAWSRI